MPAGGLQAKNLPADIAAGVTTALVGDISAIPAGLPAYQPSPTSL